MIVKYIEKGTTSTCISTVIHAIIEKNEETGKYIIVMFVPESFVEIIINHDRGNYVDCMEIINELYEKEKIDFTTNKQVTCEKVINLPVTDDIINLAAMEEDDIDDIDDEELDDYF